MAYAAEGKAATGIRRGSISSRTMNKQTTGAATNENKTKRSSVSSLKKHQQPQGERQDERSGESVSRLDQGDDALIYTAQFNYVAQKSTDLSFSKGKSPSQVVLTHLTTGCMAKLVTTYNIVV